MKIVEAFGRVIGVDLGPTEVITCHRLPAGNQDNEEPPWRTNIVLKLAKRSTRKAIFMNWIAKEPLLSDLDGFSHSLKTKISVTARRFCDIEPLRQQNESENLAHSLQKTRNERDDTVVGANLEEDLVTVEERSISQASNT